ncbi:MAG: dockerin type I repeat-containing protein [Clostridia bacterium]|nr:dockerin type I repeat-containing protein [Clostridia bacterium]
MKRKFTALFLALMMILGAMPLATVSAVADEAIWDGSIATNFERGSGTKEDPYVIVNGAQLALLAQQVNGGERYRDRYFVLGADIVLNDVSDVADWDTNAPDNRWTPIGLTPDNAFEGSFDGKGHTVYGVYIDMQAKFIGTFGYTLHATMNNMRIEQSYVRGRGYAIKVGGMLGCGEFSAIDNCHFSGVVDANGDKTIVGDTKYDYQSPSGSYLAAGHVSHVGGVAGYAVSSTVTACSAKGDVFGATDNDASQMLSCIMAGGVVGMVSSGTIVDCENDAAIHVNARHDPNVGGVVGYLHRSELEDCINRGTVEARNGTPAIGGIFGGASGATISRSRNDGDIYVYGGNTSMGGVGGNINNSDVIDCMNCGAVQGDFYEWSCVGGVIGGYIGGALKNCYNVGTVVLNGDGRCGGLIGSGSNVTVENGYYLMMDGVENGYGMALSQTAMNYQESFVGFDFESVWTIDTNAAYPYPTLRKSAMLGDLNGNGVLNMIDVMCLYAAISGEDLLGTAALGAADYNGDGVVNMMDLMALYKTVSGQ